MGGYAHVHFFVYGLRILLHLLWCGYPAVRSWRQADIVAEDVKTVHSIALPTSYHCIAFCAYRKSTLQDANRHYHGPFIRGIPQLQFLTRLLRPPELRSGNADFISIDYYRS